MVLSRSTYLRRRGLHRLDRSNEFCRSIKRVPACPGHSLRHIWIREIENLTSQRKTIIDCVMKSVLAAYVGGALNRLA